MVARSKKREKDTSSLQNKETAEVFHSARRPRREFQNGGENNNYLTMHLYSTHARADQCSPGTQAVSLSHSGWNVWCGGGGFVLSIK